MLHLLLFLQLLLRLHHETSLMRAGGLHWVKQRSAKLDNRLSLSTATG